MNINVIKPHTDEHQQCNHKYYFAVNPVGKLLRGKRASHNEKIQPLFAAIRPPLPIFDPQSIARYQRVFALFKIF